MQLCRWYFLHCIMYMTVSVIIMQVTVSVITMQVTVSSKNYIFLSLTPIFHTSRLKGSFSNFLFPIGL